MYTGLHFCIHSPPPLSPLIQGQSSQNSRISWLSPMQRWMMRLTTCSRSFWLETQMWGRRVWSIASSLDNTIQSSRTLLGLTLQCVPWKLMARRWRWVTYLYCVFSWLIGVFHPAISLTLLIFPALSCHCMNISIVAPWAFGNEKGKEAV